MRFQNSQCEAMCYIAGDYNIDLLKVKQKTIINQYPDTLISLSCFSKITLPTRLSNKHKQHNQLNLNQHSNPNEKLQIYTM